MDQSSVGIVILTLGVVFATHAFAETDVPVRLNVTADAELTRELVECLEERLGAFPGVQIKADAEVQLRLIALEQKATDGSTFGYLFYQAGLVPSQDPAAFSVLWETLRSLPPDLAAACDRLASDYQAEVVAPVRDGLERFREQLSIKAPSG